MHKVCSSTWHLTFFHFCSVYNWRSNIQFTKVHSSLDSLVDIPKANHTIQTQPQISLKVSIFVGNWMSTTKLNGHIETWLWMQWQWAKHKFQIASIKRSHCRLACKLGFFSSCKTTRFRWTSTKPNQTKSVHCSHFILHRHKDYKYISKILSVIWLHLLSSCVENLQFCLFVQHFQLNPFREHFFVHAFNRLPTIVILVIVVGYLFLSLSYFRFSRPWAAQWYFVLLFTMYFGADDIEINLKNNQLLFILCNKTRRRNMTITLKRTSYEMFPVLEILVLYKLNEKFNIN